MPDYRIYAMTKDNHIVGVPQIIACDHDHEAISKAEQLVEGKDVELWDGADW